MTANSRCKALVWAFALVHCVTATCSAQGPVDTRGLDSDIVRLRGVRSIPIEDVRALFPSRRGQTGIYDDGAWIRVFDPRGEDGAIERHFRRTGNQVEERERRVLRFVEDRMVLVEYGDPLSGEFVELARDDWDARAFAGRPGDEVAVKGGLLRCDGIEEIEIAGKRLRCARFAMLQVDGPGAVTPARETKRLWIDLETGIPALEALALTGDREWRPTAVLTDVAVVPESLLASDSLRDHVREAMLGLGTRTIMEPEDPEVVPVVADSEIDPARLPTGRSGSQPDRILLRKIVVTGGPLVIGEKRDLATAEVRARALVRLARKRGVSFGEVARVYSDDATAVMDGYAGVYSAQELGGQGAEVIAGFALGVGQVSDPVSVRDGFAIVTREEVLEYCAGRILLGYVGTDRPIPGVQVTRTREAAAKLAREIRARIAAGQSFSSLAVQYSDSPEGRHGGALGIFLPGTYDRAVEAALARLEPGEVSEPIETRHGLVLVERRPVRRVQATVVRITWNGAVGARPEITRTKEEALELARIAIARLGEEGVDPGGVAAELSDDPRVDSHRGDTGALDPARLPAYLAALPGTSVGAVVGPIDSPSGYWIYKRTR